MLKTAGLSISDVNVQVIPTASIVPALENGSVDAIVFSRLRYYAMQNAGYSVGQILSDGFLPSFGNVLITSPSFLAKNPKAVAGFIAALHESINWISQGHALGAAEFSIATAAQSFPSQEQQIADVLNSVYIPSLWHSGQTYLHGLGYGNLTRWQADVNAQQSFGLIPSGIPGVQSFVIEPSTLLPKNAPQIRPVAHRRARKRLEDPLVQMDALPDRRGVPGGRRPRLVANHRSGEPPNADTAHTGGRRRTRVLPRAARRDLAEHQDHAVRDPQGARDRHAGRHRPRGAVRTREARRTVAHAHSRGRAGGAKNLDRSADRPLARPRTAIEGHPSRARVPLSDHDQHGHEPPRFARVTGSSPEDRRAARGAARTSTGDPLQLPGHRRGAEGRSPAGRDRETVIGELLGSSSGLGYLESQGEQNDDIKLVLLAILLLCAVWAGAFTPSSKRSTGGSAVGSEREAAGLTEIRLEAERMSFGKRFASACAQSKYPLCLGLDPRLDEMPELVRNRAAAEARGDEEAIERAIADFHALAIEATVGLVSAVKLQMAFYEQMESPA